MDTSTTSAIEASASSSTGASVSMDTGLDLSSSQNEEGPPADLPQESQSQYVEDKEMLDTKNNQQFGWADGRLLRCCARKWLLWFG